MTTLNLTAEQAMARSEECDEIVTIEGSEEIHETLLGECSDSVEHHVDHEDGYTLTEYWKNDPNSSDGMLWRVHVRDDDDNAADTVTVADVAKALAHIVEIRIDDENSAHITNYAPDSSDPEYGGSTEPGSAWNEECERLLTEIREALPMGWEADWSDDDVSIARA